MQSTRQNKVARLIQKELGDIFLKSKTVLDLDNKLMITVTTVRVTPDLKIARSYLSIFPSELAADAISKLTSAKKQIRFQLGNLVRNQLKEVPDLEFFIDDSLDYIDRIESLLKK